MKKLFTLVVAALLLFVNGKATGQEWALDFDTAQSSYVDCGFDANLFPENLTIEAWVYVDAWVGGGNYILATENWTEETGPMGYAIRLYPDIGAEFVLGLGENQWGVVSSGYDTFDSLQWQHVACTFDGTTMKVYVNGVFMLDQDVTGPMLASTANLILGEGSTWRGRHLDGKLYDVRLWNVARTEEEILSTMNSFLNGDEAGLVANWKMDEGTGTTLHDATGNYPGAIQTGVKWFERAGSTPEPTYADWALEFDTAQSSYVDCGFNAGLFPESHTLEAWVYVDSWVGGGNYILATENWTEETGPMGYAIRLYPDIGAEYVLGLGQNQWGVVSSGYDTFDSLQWQHVACTFDGTTMKVYVNGEFMLDQDVAGPMLASTSNLILGEGATWRGRHLDGKLFDVRLWNIARSEDEIQSTMYSFLSGNETGLVANWKMDEGTGTTLNDATGNYPGSIQEGVKWYSLSATGVPRYSNSDIGSFFPNPVNSHVTLKNNNRSITTVDLIDITGKLLYSRILEPGENRSIDLSYLSNGIYLLRFENSGRTQVEKLLKN